MRARAQGYGQEHGARPRRYLRLPVALAAAALSLSFCVLLALSSTAVGARAPSSARSSAAGQIPGPKRSPTPTATTASISLMLLSPSSGRGPVGANLSVSGAGYAGSSVRIFASTDAGCTATNQPLGSAPVSGGAITLYTFVWPASLSQGQYFVCAPGVSSAPSYTVLTNEPPALSLSASQVPVGQQVTITGTSFFTPEISLSLAQGAQNTPLGPLTPDASGHFAYTFQVGASYANTYTVVAESDPENGAPAALRATVKFSVVPAGSATAGGLGSTPGAGAAPLQGSSGGSLGLIVVLIVGILLVLLAIAGVVAYLVIRRRGGEPGIPPVPVGPDSRAGPYFAHQTGRFGATDRFGRPLLGATEPLAQPTPGAVAGWDEPDAVPGAGWQPKPMTGRVRGFDQSMAPGLPADAPSQGALPPLDPWPGLGPGTGPSSGAGGGLRGYDAGAVPPSSQRQGGEGGNVRREADWPDLYGPGSTRPDGQG